MKGKNEQAGERLIGCDGAVVQCLLLQHCSPVVADLEARLWPAQWRDVVAGCPFAANARGSEAIVTRGVVGDADADGKDAGGAQVDAQV